jgi:DNA (cytosine-5)-methyltransferase 1
VGKVKLVYGSVCSGISSESIAWKSLGWKAAWFSQFDPEHNYKTGPDFSSAVLAYHHPHIPNLGDANEIHERTEFKKQEIDILVGGTPCQTFSPAGQRQGLIDPRGKLALRFLEIAEMRRPRWIVWENVPDVLSSKGGKDFGAILRKLGSIGYGYSWHVLDAQHFGVPQSRRRLFVVGYLGDWKRAAAVFSGREDMRPNHRPNEGAGDADACRDDQGSPGAGTEAIAVQGNLIGRSDEAGPRGPGWRTAHFAAIAVVPTKVPIGTCKR